MRRTPYAYAVLAVLAANAAQAQTKAEPDPLAGERAVCAELLKRAQANGKSFEEAACVVDLTLANLREGAAILPAMTREADALKEWLAETERRRASVYDRYVKPGVKQPKNE